MRKRIWIVLVLAAVCLLCGCQIRTVDQMYRVPKRPESYNDLQKVMDAAMAGMEYRPEFDTERAVRVWPEVFEKRKIPVLIL